MFRLFHLFLVLLLSISFSYAGKVKFISRQKIDYLQTKINPSQEGYWIGPIGVAAVMHHGDEPRELAPQCWVNVVEEGSPAEGKLKRGDIIVGIDGEKFSYGDPRIEIGNRIIQAETDGKPFTFKVFRPSQEVVVVDKDAKPEIYTPDESSIVGPSLEVVDDFQLDKTTQEVKEEKAKQKAEKAAPVEGSYIEVSFTLPVLGPYSETSPANCVRSQKIVDNCIKYLKDYRKNNKRGTIKGRLSAIPLALLATEDPENIALVKEYMLAQGLDKGIDDIERTMLNSHYHSWFKGYEGVLLGEYYFLTGDKTFFDRMRDNAIRISLGQDDNGLWGHGFARNYIYRGRSLGRSIAYGNVNAAGLPCFVAVCLAKKAGIEDPRIDLAIKRAADYYRTYVGKGRIGYGFHGPSPGQGSNGKMGVAGAAYAVLEDWESMRYFSKCSITYRFRGGGHGGVGFNEMWGGLGSNLASVEGAASYYKSRRWHCTLVRSWDGSFKYQETGGSINGGKYNGVTTGAYLLNYLSYKRSLFILGKGVPKEEMLTKKDREEAEFTFSFGKTHDLPKMTVSELVPLLSYWASGIRTRVAGELATRNPDEVIPHVRKLLQGGNAWGTYGAARVAIGLKENSKALWPDLLKVLDEHDDYYLIKLCAQGLESAGDEAFPALMKNSGRKLPGEFTPERLQSIHRTLGNVAWGKYSMSNNPLEYIRKNGLSEELFINSTREAIAKGYDPVYSRGITKFFTAKQMVMFFDALYFSSTLDPNSSNLAPFSSKFIFKETLPFIGELTTKVFSGRAKPEMARPLAAYGSHAKAYLPSLKLSLKSTDKYLQNTETKKMELNDNYEALDRLVKAIESDQKPPKLLSIRQLMKDYLSDELKDLSDKKSKIDFLLGVLKGPYWEYMRHGVALELLSEIDLETAHPEIDRSIGPGENFRELIALELASKYFSKAEIKSKLSSSKYRPLAGFIRIYQEIFPGIPKEIRPFINNSELSVRLAAYDYMKDYGTVEDAVIIATSVSSYSEDEMFPAEEAINAINKRSSLKRALLEVIEPLAYELLGRELSGWTKHELNNIYRGGVNRSSFSSLRILSLCGSKPLFKLREAIEKGDTANDPGDKKNYLTQIDYLLAKIAPLIEDIDGGLDPDYLNKIPSYEPIASYFMKEIKIERIPKKFVRPLLDYLLKRGKMDPYIIKSSLYSDLKEQSAIEYQKSVKEGKIVVPSNNLLDQDGGGGLDDF